MTNIKVRFLKDGMGEKKGEELFMDSAAVDMCNSENPGLLEIIDSILPERKLEAKKIRDKHVLEVANKVDDKETATTLLNVDPTNFDIIKGNDSEEIKEKAFLIKNYLESPTLFNEITETEFDKQIVGEIPTRKVIFLCACGRLVENCQIASYNLLVTSSAGAGKDYVVNKVLSILPSQYYVKKTRISPTVFTYWHNAKYEPEWNWDGKVFYTEDISESVMNSEVFKVMTSSGSQATIVIKQRAVDIDIKGKPVVITTTATATPNPELTRRFEFCNLDEGIEQTKEIMKRHSEYAQKGILPCFDKDYTSAMQYLQRVKVKIPFANLIHSYFPDKNIMMRTKYPRFLDFIKASCAFHQFQRKKDKEGYYIAEELDYEIAREAIKKLASNKYLIPLTINQKKIMAILENLTKNMLQEGKTEVQFNAQDLLIKMNNIMALKNFINNLGLLTSYGLLKSEIKQQGYKELEFYSLPTHLLENDIFDLPHFKDLIEIEKVLK